jgi:hypothetical protein
VKRNSNQVPPALLADMLDVHAWEDHLADETRLLIELAAKAIRRQYKQNVRLAKTLETTEAKNAND